MSWFEARDQCRLKKQIIRATSNSSTSFWTKYYTRRSHWMAALGNSVIFILFYSCIKCNFQICYIVFLFMTLQGCSLGVPFENNTFETVIRIHPPSEGICQELCIEHFGSNKFFLFALKVIFWNFLKDESFIFLRKNGYLYFTRMNCDNRVLRIFISRIGHADVKKTVEQFWIWI